MGNLRFRLSDILPNTWLKRMRDMGHRGRQSSRAAVAKPAAPLERKLLPNRASCYYSSRPEGERLSFSSKHRKASDSPFPVEPHRNSRKKKPLRASVVKPGSVGSSVCRSRELKTDESLPPAKSPSETWTRRRDCFVEFESDDVESWLNSGSCGFTSSATDLDSSKNSKLDEFELDSVLELKLPPISTKRSPKEVEFEDKIVDGNSWKDQNLILVKEKSTSEKPSHAKVGSPCRRRRLRTRANSPRFSSQKVHRQLPAATAQKKKGLPAGGVAVVKCSSDPQRDFRESMAEMIAENNIRSSEDLEELLACYLFLNSSEHHDVVVKAFRQIWFHLTDTI
ncbi:transcription repressor OFP3-like [Zingiber officinale]|uniref:Transcription repressor n=1 Tax=Zingiber officinale TaxID=94328 RepID=A0A8J5L769_ZINOF|nr:transcription repressor OFP3-like [Zingiber officinale]KAG6508025.1 hypothetical protein ZIOFF_033380 [Zingiber officinale]